MKRLSIILLVVSNAIAFGQFGPQQVISTAYMSSFQSLLEDLDSDGDIDIAFSSSSSINTQGIWFANDGNGNFSFEQIFSPSLSAMSMHFVDLDQDGVRDIVARDEAGTTIFWCKNGGGGSFFSPQVLLNSSTVTDISLGDFDNDGDTDIVFSEGFGSSDECSFMENSGAGVFNAPVAFGANTDGGYRIEAADLDQDGFLDVLLGNYFDQTVSWFQGNGNGTFGVRTIIGSCGVPNPFMADLDIDGDFDVYCTDPGFGGIEHFINGGSNQFTQAPSINTMCLPDWLYTDPFLDIDGDGDQDMALACGTNAFGINWYENLGGGSFSPPISVTTAVVQPRYVDGADLDGDGDMDLISLSDSLIAWYENLGGMVGIHDRPTAMVSLWPNPTNDQLRVSLSSGMISNIAIYGIDSKLLLSSRLWMQNVTELDVSVLHSGVYTLWVIDNDGNRYFENLVIR